MSDNTIGYVAVDIGASSGRHIYAELKDGKLTAREVYRFTNSLVEKNGSLCWDVEALFGEILNGLKKSAELGFVPDFIALDTFGVDYVLLDEDRKPTDSFFSYRDHRTDNYENDVSECITFRDLYRINGIQKMQLNTVCQLAVHVKQNPEAFRKASRLIMIPDYINYLLTGKISCEYTDASTTGLLDAEKRDWSDEIIAAFNLPRDIFIKPTMPGVALGRVKKSIADEIGCSPVVLMTASHDTGAAVLGSSDSNSVYISCGTWSLIGTLLDKPFINDATFEKNFTNEGGFEGNIRFLRNIMGLWIIQSLKRESTLSYDDIMYAAIDNIGTKLRIDVNHPDFLAPSSMTDAIKSHLPDGTSMGELYAVVYLSLADSYKKAVDDLESVCGRTFPNICLFGGGVKDKLLCELTAKATGKKLVKGPSEATALGNIAGQLIASGVCLGVDEAREMISETVFIK